MINIKIPQNLSLLNSLKFCNKLWNLEQTDEYEFEFKNLGHVEPFSIAYVANELKRFRDTKPDSKFTAKNSEPDSYAGHMGLFKAFGFETENNPSEASGNSSYIPLTRIKVSELEKEALNNNLNIGDVIEKRSNEIAKLLTGHNSGELLKTLTFSILEILMNVVEHSESQIIEYCAHYWPTKKLVEIAIFDNGTGLLKGLSLNPNLKIKDEREALHLALLPGISGKMYEGIPKIENNEWQNRGFGLYMTSRICRNGGDFFVVSNNNSLLFKGKEKQDIECHYQGTALRLRIDTNKITTLSKMLSIYKKEGMDISNQFS